MKTPPSHFYDTVAISDVHLGSNLCQATALVSFLKQSSIKKLVLIGDIFDNLNMKRLSKEHFNVLKQIRHLTKHSEVIWIRGNHDEISNNLMSLILGVEVLNSYEWTETIVKNDVEHTYNCFAIHGDIWDVYIYKYKTITKIATFMFNLFQKINSEWLFHYTRKLKTLSKQFTRNVEGIRNSAFEYAKQKNINVILCGHTHCAELVKNGHIIYGNDGTWQTDEPTFIHIKSDLIELYSFKNDNPLLISDIRLQL